MKTITKVALVVLGYVVAAFVAYQAVVVHMALTANDSKGADGMYAFGDSLLFIGISGLIALLPTGAAIYFFRANKSLWSGLSTAALFVGVTAPLAVLAYAVPLGGAFEILSGLALLRLFLCPLLFFIFLVCGAFSSASTSRKKLFLASALEAVVLGYILFSWLFGQH